MVFLFRLLSRFPLALLHNLGALLGWLVYAYSPRYRQHLRENTAQAGTWAIHARHAAISEAGKGVLELPWIWLRPHTQVVEQVVRVTNWSLVEEAWQRQQGIIFLTPHLGCFEITAQYFAQYAPITVLYRPPKQTWLRQLVEASRGANLKLAPADLSGVRHLMKALKKHEAIGMLPDQAPGRGEGIWTPFFGRPAYTMTLAARLAETGSALIFAYAERLPYGAGYHLKLQTLNAPLQGTLEERTAQLNRSIEELIRECPEQYMWAYNRYKIPAGAPPPELGKIHD